LKTHLCADLHLQLVQSVAMIRAGQISLFTDRAWLLWCVSHQVLQHTTDTRSSYEL